jgi:hypothetical protein
MFHLNKTLDLPRCPHCGVNSPNLHQTQIFETNNADKTERQIWAIYVCRRCGGVVSAKSNNPQAVVQAYYPSALTVDDEIPDRARAYLQQAYESLHVPAGAVMLAASAVDAMLKTKGFTSGSLYSRIDKARDDRVITNDMATWAHQVRLEANDQRHADEERPLPSGQDAERSIEFASALAQFLFVLPSRVQRGLSGGSA